MSAKAQRFRKKPVEVEVMRLDADTDATYDRADDPHAGEQVDHGGFEDR